MGETRDEIINITSKLSRASKSIGLCVNEDKTKYLLVAKRSSNIDYITVDNYKFEKMDVFKYLNVNINSSNDIQKINEQIACGKPGLLQYYETF